MSDVPLPRPVRSAWHDAAPIGDRLSARPLVEDPMTAFEGDLRLAPLAPMLEPEEPRHGELDPASCFHCSNDAGHWIWADEHWHVGALQDTALPFWAGLAPNAHTTLTDMPTDLAATMGPVIQRLATAIASLPGVARTHFSRWGDGSAHFHLHFLARPTGMMQGRGYMLAVWDDVLPKADPDLIAANNRQVAEALAAGGGELML